MRRRLAALFAKHRFAAILSLSIATVLIGGTIVATAGQIKHFVIGTIDYEDTTSGPVILGEQSGTGIALEGVTTTSAPAGAIALDGFGTSTTEASVGVNGSVDGPGSTALIGSANGTTGASSIGLEGFSANGEGVFAESTNADYASLRSVDSNVDFDVRLSDTPDVNSLSAYINETSTTGNAVFGDDPSATANNNDGVLGIATNGDNGVEGDASDDSEAGVAGFGTDGTSGVFGTSDTFLGGNFGSGSNDGAEGLTNNPSATTLEGAGGLFGLDNSSDDGGLNWGVLGVSGSGTGVVAQSDSGTGLSSTSTESYGIEGTAETSGTAGVIGLQDAHVDADAAGVVGLDESGDAGVWGVGAFAVVAECAGTGQTDEYYGENSGGVNYQIDCTGAPAIVHSTRNGGYAESTVPQSTQAVLEDYGEAQLVNGVAEVKLDSTYAETITDRSPYLVFLTPDGDTNGLYVASKSMTGFEVREVRGGHSNLTFDYRIVGKPADDSHPRMALMATRPRGPGHFVDMHALRPAMSSRTLAAQVAQARRQFAAASARHQSRARLITLRSARNARLPLYEPRIGADGKLHPGQPYTPIKSN